MNKSYFKTSQELGIQNNDAAFMARFENTLRLEPLVKASPKKISVLLLEIFILALAGAASIWILWPSATRLASTSFVQLWEGFSNLGVSVTVVLMIVSALAYLVSEIRGDAFSDIF
jgi:hypothetical protein